MVEGVIWSPSASDNLEKATAYIAVNSEHCAAL